MALILLFFELESRFDLLLMKDSKNNQDTLAYHLMVYERFLLTDALRRANGNCAQAARELGTTERIFFYKVKKHSIDYRQFRKTKSK
jgi:transcriptional regulator with GAF, ATPase, and Fis domain